MAKKNTFLTVTASAVIASSLFGAQGVEAATHKVKSGENLWDISNKYKTNVSNLKTWNNLSSNLIYPNQVLKIDKSNANSTTSKKSSTKTSSTSSKTSSTYTVKSGDTLGQIASAQNISLNNLMKWNDLSTTLIYPGDKLNIKNGGTTTSKTTSNQKNTNASSSNKTNTSAPSKSGTYTVKSGDTLGKIAANHGVSLNNLKKWNNLSSHMIYPGDKLNVGSSSASKSSTTTKQKNNKSTSSSSNTSKKSSSNKNASTYTVKSGDTLGAIASSHGVSVSNLKKWNNLSSNLIHIGDKLTLKGATSTTQSTSNKTSNKSEKTSNTNNKTEKTSNTNNISAPSSGDLISNAKSVVGTPYVWAGNTPSGFDCSGFIYWAFNESGQDISRLSTDGYYDRSYMVDSPSVGDLVFFEGTYRSGISHMGIYVGNNEFIHAGSSTGVTVTNLDNPYWSQHFHSFKRFY